MRTWIISVAALAACVTGAAAWLAARDARDAADDLFELDRRVAERDALACPEPLFSLHEIAPGWRAELEKRWRDRAKVDELLAEVAVWKTTPNARAESSRDPRPLERAIDACESRALELLVEAEKGDTVPSVERVAALRRAVDAIQYVSSVDDLVAWSNEYWSWLE